LVYNRKNSFTNPVLALIANIGAITGQWEAKQFMTCGTMFYVRSLNTRPARAFCAARDAFWEFSYNQNLSYSVYSPVFIGSRPASENCPFKRT